MVCVREGMGVLGKRFLGVNTDGNKNGRTWHDSSLKKSVLNDHPLLSNFRAHRFRLSFSFFLLKLVH